MGYSPRMDPVSFWLNPVLIVGIGLLIWRFLVKKFDRIDMQFRDLTGEVVANGKGIARIEGHPRYMATVE